MERAARPLGIGSWLPRPLKVVLTFGVVCLCWVVFRADSLGEAGRYYEALFGLGETAGRAWWMQKLLLTPETLVVLGLALVVTWFGISAPRFATSLTWPRTVLLMILFWISLAAMAVQSQNPFLYYFF
jgi:hypothetical protein